MDIFPKTWPLIRVQVWVTAGICSAMLIGVLVVLLFFQTTEAFALYALLALAIVWIYVVITTILAVWLHMRSKRQVTAQEPVHEAGLADPLHPGRTIYFKTADDPRLVVDVVAGVKDDLVHLRRWPHPVPRECVYTDINVAWERTRHEVSQFQ